MTPQTALARRPAAERGQILLISAGVLIILLAVGALVVDLGFSWMLRRQEQNAADAAALAAARHIDDVTGATFDWTLGTEAACAYAQQNGFFVGDAGCVAALASGELDINFPPNASAGDYAGDSGKVQVVIRQQRDTLFGVVLGQPTATVSTQAVASRERGENTTNSLHLLDPAGCASLLINGNPLVHIYPAPGVTAPGGNVQINSSCGFAQSSDDACSNSEGGLRIDGTNADLYAPKVNVVGGCRTTQADEPHGVLDEAASYIGDPLGSLRFPSWDTSIDGATCGAGGPATRATGAQANGCGNNPMNWVDAPCPPPDESIDCVSLQPGVYYGGWRITTNTRVNLAPGIYVIAGGGITIAGSGFLDSVDAAGSPAPVLIFNTDNPVAKAAGICPMNNDARCQQDLDLSTNESLQLTGLLRDAPCPPATSPTAPGCPFGGMVIWYDGQGSQSAARSGEITMAGGTELFVSGTIYAPYATVNLGGTSATNTNAPECPAGATQVAAVQIISWRLELSGDGDLCMPYDPSGLYKRNEQGLVH
jgi:hypothetical protein